MARRSKLGNWFGREKRRCAECRKRCKDIINDIPLCRLHSPTRLGYIGANK